MATATCKAADACFLICDTEILLLRARYVLTQPSAIEPSSWAKCSHLPCPAIRLRDPFSSVLAASDVPPAAGCSRELGGHHRHVLHISTAASVRCRVSREPSAWRV